MDTEHVYPALTIQSKIEPRIKEAVRTYNDVVDDTGHKAGMSQVSCTRAILFEQLEQLERQLNRLRHILPAFDSNCYPVHTLRFQLERATEYEHFITLHALLRQYSMSLNFTILCQSYQQLLSNVNIPADLRVSFDHTEPELSHTALMAQVRGCLDKHIANTYKHMQMLIQFIRYNIRIQEAPLEHVYERANNNLHALTSLWEQITVEMIEDLRTFNTAILQPLSDLREEGHLIEEVLRGSSKRRAVIGSELELIKVFQGENACHELDLRELIVGRLDQGEKTINLDSLMNDLKSLFQKNMVDIRIGLARSRYW